MYFCIEPKVKLKGGICLTPGSTHMLEADVIIRGCDPKEPVMAHPPDTDSDITLKEWLEEVKMQHRGIKLDFKR